MEPVATSGGLSRRIGSKYIRPQPRQQSKESSEPVSIAKDGNCVTVHCRGKFLERAANRQYRTWPEKCILVFRLDRLKG